MRKAAGAAAAALLLAACPTVQAQIVLGGPKVGPDVEAAMAKARAGDRSELLRLAAAGRSDAQAAAGVLLAFSDRPTPMETDLGCRYLQSASAERADAMHILGEAFQNGVCGGRKDVERAIATFHKAGDMGLAKSRCAEGNLLIAQNRDVPHAVELCREGAEKGDPDAQTDLANFYLLGQIVPKDMAAARQWYEKAAAQGQANAALVLGQIYWNADGVPRDTRRAAELWRIAYEHGREDAALLLGNEAFLRAERGPGKWDRDVLTEARDWYAKAVGARNPDIAKQARERLELSDQLIGVMHRRGH